MATEPNDRYGAVSVTLHWTIAVLLTLNVALGLLMQNGGPGPNMAFAMHATVGITVLVLTLVRVVWRITHPWPPLPRDMAIWEQVLARSTHVAFYGLLIAVPLAGWAAVSARSPEGVSLFGGAPWPALPVPEGRAAGERFGGLHEALVWSTVALIALHVAGALKNTYSERRGELARMIPSLRERGRVARQGN